MSGVTHSWMRDVRDAEDSRLLESGEIDFLLAGWSEEGWGEFELVVLDGSTAEGFTPDVELQLTLEAFVAMLPRGDGEVAHLWLLGSLEADQIAERLGKGPNAVYLARFRITRRLREWLGS